MTWLPPCKKDRSVHFPDSRDDTGNHERGNEKHRSAFQGNVSSAGSVPVTQGVVLEVTGAETLAHAVI